MSARQHIVLVCSRLDLPGGTERASVNLANLLHDNGHPVTIVVADETGATFYALRQGVRLVQTALHFGITEGGNLLTRKLELYRHVKALRAVLRQLSPFVVIGTEYHLTITSRLAAVGQSFAVLGWEHHHMHWLRKNRFWSLLFRMVYPRLAGVVCQNRREKELFGAMGCTAHLIPYVLPLTGGARACLEEKKILTIGWLIRRKGMDLIPSIARKVYEKHPDWRWKLIGTGEWEHALQKEISEKGLDGWLTLQRPQSQEISDEYRQASIYVMTSRFECLPLVLLEATSFGLPCIAFDCPTGPADIIAHTQNGLLLPLEDVEGMAAAINSLIEQEELRKSMGEEAYRSSFRYASPAIYRSWKGLFDQLPQ